MINISIVIYLVDSIIQPLNNQAKCFVNTYT